VVLSTSSVLKPKNIEYLLDFHPDLTITRPPVLLNIQNADVANVGDSGRSPELPRSVGDEKGHIRGFQGF
jgi:hypothetical protein